MTKHSSGKSEIGQAMLNHMTYVHTFPEIQTPSLRLNGLHIL